MPVVVGILPDPTQLQATDATHLKCAPQYGIGQSFTPTGTSPTTCAGFMTLVGYAKFEIWATPLVVSLTQTDSSPIGGGAAANVWF